MKNFYFKIVSLIIIGLCSSSFYAQTTTLVTKDANGNLVYEADSKGNVVPDFSYAGYHHSEKSIPSVAVVETISAQEGDNLANIQDAIDLVSNLTPDANGIKGAVLLQSGTYNVNGTIYLKSGVVLRGEGVSTTVRATHTTQVTLIAIGQANIGKPVVNTSSKVKITDSYVALGAKSFNVESGHTLTIGDKVILTRKPNQAWIDALGMDNLSANDPEDTDWTPKSFTIDFKRVVTNVQGNQITIDAPVVDYIDATYAEGFISKYTSEGLEEIGVENMRLESSYASDTDENHAWRAIEVFNAENCWIKNVKAYYFAYAAVDLNKGSYKITVDNCEMRDPKSREKSGRRYPFVMTRTEQSLFKNCLSFDCRHDFVTNSRVAGPNVYYNCIAERSLTITGPHAKWATGILYDNIKTDNRIALENRENSGSGHGWAGAQNMLWNVETSDAIVLHDPPLDHVNWAIGPIGGSAVTNVGYDATEPIGIVESDGTHIVEIPSLFIAQLNDRLTINPLDAPSDLTATVIGTDEINLSWNDNSSNESGFNLERKTTGENWTLLETLGSDVIAYTDIGLTPGVEYQYRIQAYNQTDFSSWSNTATAITLNNLKLNPTHDSYVRGGSNEDKNYGDETEIRVKYSSNPANLRRAFLNFDLDHVDNIDMVTSAVLRLYPSTLSEPLDVTLYEISDNNWDEGTITSSNAPTFGSEIGTINITTTDEYFEWDVLDYIQNKVTNNQPLVSFAFQHPSNSTENVRFNSKEAMANMPELLISFTPSASNPLDAPSDLTATVIGTDEINLSWNDNSSNESGFNLERKTTGENWTLLETLGSDVIAYTDIGLTPGVEYQYRIQAYNQTDFSSWSNTATAITLNNLKLNPTHDSYVRGGSNEDKNYGDETEIRVKYSSNPANLRRAFLNFDLDHVDDIDMVTSAVLRLYPSTLSEPLDVTLYEISDNNWDEGTITSSNAPTFGSEIGTINITTTDEYFEWDVLDYIQNKVTNNQPLVSFAFQHPSNSTENVRFNSKEAMANMPELVVLYAPTLSSASRSSKSNRISTDNIHKQPIKELKAKVFPNPVKTNNLTLSYEIDHDSDVSLGIFSIEGGLISQPIHKEYHSTGTYSKSIKMNNVRNGIYFIRFISNNQYKTFRVIVNK